MIGPTQPATVLYTVADKAYRDDIPVMFIQCVGFYSAFSIQLPERFPIVETHPDPESTQDLRLVQPWPELAEYAQTKTQDLDSMSDHDHGHVPYLLLLLYYLAQWKSLHGSYPNVFKDKTAFREQLRAAARTKNPEGGEENFEEATSAVLKSLNPPSVPSGLNEIFAEPECQSPTAASASFWLIAHALSSFVASHHVLPLPGAVPDMKAQSADYIDLQKLYRAKAQADLASITHTVRQLEQDLGRTPMAARDIEAFCKGAGFIKLVRGRRIPLVPAPPTQQVDWAGRAAVVARELGEPESAMAIYLALAALNRGCAAIPNVVTDPSAAVAYFADGAVPEAVQAAADALLASLATEGVEFDAEDAKARVGQALKEVARSGPVELHNIASLTGGLVAQEAIKVITKQYVPADNTVVFDGVSSRTGTFRL